MAKPTARRPATSLGQLYQAAATTDRQEDWLTLYRAVAGTLMVVPLSDQTGETARPRLVSHDGLSAVQAFDRMDTFAASLKEPSDYAELSGAHLAQLLDGQDTALLVQTSTGEMPILIDQAALAWIAMTFGADVEREAAEGVTVSAPPAPDLALMQALGEAVGALGADCPEAWLVQMTDTEGGSELVLVLGLSDAARRMEGDIAETVTRAVQPATNERFAVACPDRGSALMDTARRTGIGIGGE